MLGLSIMFVIGVLLGSTIGGVGVAVNRSRCTDKAAENRRACLARAADKHIPTGVASHICRNRTARRAATDDPDAWMVAVRRAERRLRRRRL